MESNFKNNNGGYKFNNNFQPQTAAAQPVVEEVVEAPKAGFIKTGTKWVANSVNNLPKPAKAGLVVAGVVITILVIDKFALNGRIKKSVLGVFGFGKKKDSNNEETATEGVKFEETK